MKALCSGYSFPDPTSTTFVNAWEELPANLKDVMYDYQKDGFLYCLSREGRALIADEMGLGKTIQSLAVAHHYKNQWPLLIICPPSLLQHWYREISKWLAPPENEISIVKKGSDNMVNKIVIISYDLAKKAAAASQLSGFRVCICDESHALKNLTSKRTKMLTPFLTAMERIILLSGTPISNRPIELFPQLRILRPRDFHDWSKFDFGRRYCNLHHDGYKWNFQGASNIDELHNYLKTRVMIRRMKTDVGLQLPRTRRMRIEIEIQPRELKQMNKMLQDKKIKRALERVRELEEPWKHFAELADLRVELGKAKINAVCEHLKDCWENWKWNETDKILIFGHHQKVLDSIESFMDKLRVPPNNGTRAQPVGYRRIDGSTSHAHKIRSVDEFQTDPNVRILLLSMRTAYQGLNLTRAKYVVFTELDWNPTVLEQCEARAHRIGQRAACVDIHYLLAESSLDDAMWAVTRSKSRVNNHVLNGTKRSSGDDYSVSRKKRRTHRK